MRVFPVALVRDRESPHLVVLVLAKSEANETGTLGSLERILTENTEENTVHDALAIG